MTETAVLNHCIFYIILTKAMINSRTNRQRDNSKQSF